MVAVSDWHSMAHPQKRAFLTALSRKGTIRAACQAAGVGRRTYYHWTENDDEFVAAVGIAKAEFGDRLEEKCSRLGLDDKNVTALIVSLKMAGRYVEKHEYSGPGGGPIPVKQNHVHSFDFDGYNRLFAEFAGQPSIRTLDGDGTEQLVDTAYPDTTPRLLPQPPGA
jgi:hypothetical protein